MYRSLNFPGAAALAVCFFSLSGVCAESAHAAEPLPDAGILSAHPFRFQADRAIFTDMPDTPSDSRIFSPRDPVEHTAARRVPRRAFASKIQS